MFARSTLEQERRRIGRQTSSLFSRDAGEKRSGGGCSSSSGGDGQQSSNSPGQSSDGTSPNQLGEVTMEDVDTSLNEMCKKVYTVYRAIQREYTCPVAQRDNVADQTTPADDLLAMERTMRLFLNLEGKIYDPESTNPRFFASESWVQRYEKDKNVMLSLYDQFKANIIRMQHLYNVVDDKSYEKLTSIPNQDSKSTFQTNILWTGRQLKEWADGWFIDKTSTATVKLHDSDYWLPGLTGEMVSWMKAGQYQEFDMRPIAIESMIRKVDALEGVIDRMMNSESVQNAIEKFLSLKEKLEQKADQKKESVFTSTIIDSQMGKKLGVTDVGKTNEKMKTKDQPDDGTKYKAPDPDDVETVKLVERLSSVKKMFKELRDKSMGALEKCRNVESSGGGAYAQIWANIDNLAGKVYSDMGHLNCLILDQRGDFENAGKHCSVAHVKICEIQLAKRVAAIKTVIQQGVTDIMTYQAMIPKKGRNILDSMFNQLWEYGEKGPTLEMPSWCQEAIWYVNKFETSLCEAWSEVYDCWEREFITRLWRIMVEHHGGGAGYPCNWKRHQIKTVATTIDHVHPINGFTEPDMGGIHPIMIDTMKSPGDSNWISTDMVGNLCCPGHLEDLLKPVCLAYKDQDIEPLARDFRGHVKALCRWLTSAIQAIGIKQSAISAVMSDPTLNGNCENDDILKKINELKKKNNDMLEIVEKAYGMYANVENMKNKKEYDEQIALHELQPSKYSNEDQLNMTSSIQTETQETTIESEYQAEVDIEELKPWNHLELAESKVKAKEIEPKPACSKFEKVIETLASFESAMNIE